MAVDGRPDAPATPASDVAAGCREAGLVCVLGATNGEALAAVGLLGRALADAGRPFQARLVAAATDDPGATDADLTIDVGRRHTGADHATDATPERPETGAIERAYEIAATLGEADPALGLAGALAAGVEVPGGIREDAEAAGIDRRPGVAVPTTDPADGLAHTTLVHAPFSGDPAAAADAVGGLGTDDAGDEAGRRVASLLALSVAEAEACPPQATRAVERALHPYAGGPLETIGGYADVLDALARTDPGLGIALALGRGDRDDALAAWREHGASVHRAVADADVERHDGLVVTRVAAVDSPEAVEACTRLVRDFRSPEPTVLVRGPESVSLATLDEGIDAAGVLADAVDDPDAPRIVGDATLATVAIGDGHETVTEAVRRTVR